MVMVGFWRAELSELLLVLPIATGGWDRPSVMGVTSVTCNTPALPRQSKWLLLGMIRSGPMVPGPGGSFRGPRLAARVTAGSFATCHSPIAQCQRDSWPRF